MAQGLKTFGNPIALFQLATDPVTAVNGMMYYNTTSNTIRQYVNGAWEDVAGGSVSLIGQALNENHIIVGNASNESAAVDTDAVGDITANTATGLQIKAGAIVDADINASAAITLSKLAALTATRVLASDGAGVISAATFAPADVILRDGTVAFTGNVNLGGFLATNAADPVSGQDLVTLSYLEGVLDGRKWKTSVRVATVADINLASAPAAIDGVTLTTGNRVLVKNQSLPEQNGIYDYNGSGNAMTRASDANTALKLQSAAVSVEEGTVANADKQFYQTADSITLGTTAIVWVVIGTNAFIGHDMISLVGNEISVDLATVSGLESTNPGNAAGQLRVKLEGTNPTLQIDGSNQLGAKLDAAGAVQTGAGGLFVGVDDVTIERNTNALRIKDNAITNAKVDAAAAIARSKLASGTANRLVVNDGSGVMADAAAITAARALISDANGIPTHSAVTAAELLHVGGVTSSIQTQLNGKASTALSNLASVAINTSLISDTNNTDDLGSDAIEWKDLWAHRIAHGDASNPNLAIETVSNNGSLVMTAHGTGRADIKASRMRLAESDVSANFLETQYVHASTLTGSASGTADANLTFAHATYSGMIVHYRIIDTVNSRSRTGVMYVSTNGTDPAHSDEFAQTGDVGLTWESVVSGANVELRYTTTANNKTARYWITRIPA